MTELEALKIVLGCAEEHQEENGTYVSGSPQYWKNNEAVKAVKGLIEKVETADPEIEAEIVLKQQGIYIAADFRVDFVKEDAEDIHGVKLTDAEAHAIAQRVVDLGIDAVADELSMNLERALQERGYIND